jgi:predicted deacylase
VKAFGAPVSLIDKALDSSGILSTIFEKAGILNFGPELGGAGRVDPETLRITDTGLRNLLKHFGMMEGEITTPESQGRPPSRLAEVADLESYVFAPDSGIYEPFIDLLDEIEAGQPIGQVHYPDDLGKRPCVTHAPRPGFLLCKRPPGRVRRGDNVAILGQDLDLAKHGLK